MEAARISVPPPFIGKTNFILGKNMSTNEIPNNGKSTATNETKYSAPVDPEVDTLMDEMEALSSENESDQNSGSVRSYERDVTIYLPQEAGVCFGVTYITVPARMVLTALAQYDPESSERLLGIRDAFYFGDEEEDYLIQIDSGPMRPREQDEIEGLFSAQMAYVESRRPQVDELEREFGKLEW